MRAKRDMARGAQKWRSAKAKSGMEAAAAICASLLRESEPVGDMANESYRRGLFRAMYKDVAERCDPSKLVYPFSMACAEFRGESGAFAKSAGLDLECAKAVCGEAGENEWSMEGAAQRVALEYGLERLKAVLGSAIRRNFGDRRISHEVKDWASRISLPKASHLKSIDIPIGAEALGSFSWHVGQICKDLRAERFALPGKDEADGPLLALRNGHGSAHKAQVMRSIAFNDGTGIALADGLAGGVFQFKSEAGERVFSEPLYNSLVGMGWPGRDSELSDHPMAEKAYVAHVAHHMLATGAREAEAERTAPKAKPSIVSRLGSEAPKEAHLPKAKRGRKAEGR
jgi:hypothetical protein